MQKDTYNLRKVILSEPRQVSEGFEAAEGISVDGNFKSITISGMGGSALHADVLSIILEDIWERHADKTQRFAVYQNRYYALPKAAYDDCLNIICSHSGNTEETIASFEEALENKLPCVGISSGGKVEEMCKANNIPHIKLPIPFENFQPRMATIHFVASILRTLTNCGMLIDVMDEFLSEVEGMERAVVELEERGKEIAAELKGKTPVIYSSDRYRALAMVWKIKINENSKTPAFWNYLPEMNHNEMVGFTLPQADFSILLLRDPGDDPRNKKRYDVIGDVLAQKGVKTRILDIDGDTVYSKVFRTLYLGDWISYYLALAYDIDPTPVDMVEDFKKMLV